MTQRFLLAFLLAALAVASAKTYTISFNQPVTVAGTQLQAGDYRLNLDSDKVVITNGKLSAQTPVKVEESDTKFRTTHMRLTNTDGKMLVQEIDLGGTKTKLVFNN